MPEHSKLQRMSVEERLGRILVRAEVVKQTQVDEALRIHQQRPDKPLQQIFIEKGWCSEWAIAKALSKSLQKRFVSVKKALISQKVVQLVPKEMAVTHTLLPLFIQNKTLYVVMENPLDSLVLREIRKNTKLQVISMVAVASQIREAIQRHYDIDEYVGTMLDNANAPVQENAASEPQEEPEPEPRKEPKPSASEKEKASQIVKLANLIFAEGIKTRASDIHIEPSPQNVMVRYRIDGMLSRGIKLPQEVYTSLISRIKMLSGMDISDHQNPQDGRLRITYEQRNVDLRVSTIPIASGEKVVIRILDSTSRFYDITRLGFSPSHLDRYQACINEPQGLILVAGPTGSGKTTTLYAFLNIMKDGAKHIVTIEDPIEYQLEGITQIQVNPKSGMTYAHGLRSVLRQDPNVILLGEIRDAETASVSIQASETGHLVLSTLNTTNAVAAVTRLLALGIAPDVLASNLLMIIAQRLVRRVCPRCLQEYTPADQELQQIGIQGVQSEFVFHRGEGCKACRNSGYYGQVGLFELFVPTPQLRHAIEQRAPKHEFQRLAIEGGMKTLRENGIEKVFQGLTTIDEVLRVTPRDQDLLSRAQQPASQQPASQAPIPAATTPPAVQPQQPQVINCEQCGTQMQQNWMICPVCGWIKTKAPVPQARPSIPGVPAPTSAPVLQPDSLAPPESQDTQQDQRSQVDIPRSQERVVLAEDDPNTRMMVKFFLQQQGYEVILATNGDEALERIRAERPDIVILDVNMPYKDGFAVCKEMRANVDTMFTPVIMLTAQSSIEAKLQGLSLGADDYVTKPFHPAELAARIEVILRRSYLHEVVAR